ncbi:hypothetical protein A2Z33_04655 [Candidatus Gottesmanbacteria bacterium RBG_16_52_11]|uniref:Glycosyltransferase 2-like domain-containing protein n=1 Tax=Candidatus Gottesmanbacteria bacterium RBG_16_52_11 TaxID=1798374 RepID=A0A1F5YU62_9BACT|nr:MAG: hypothetical protein A2Z33_04655 [Candidatus Gottesmanbacteria bacterium RBG_16_52_11]
MYGKILKYGETGRIKLVRLGRKGAGRFERPVHEVWKINGRISDLKKPILHDSHPDIAQFLDRIDRYSTVSASHLLSSGHEFIWWHPAAYPAAKFFLNYFLKLGFLDGMPGLIMAMMMSFHSFLTRAKLFGAAVGRRNNIVSPDRDYA